MENNDSFVSQECIGALEAALGRSVFGSASHDSRRALIVINLFALEGWHIAEALGVPCAVASPCVVPYTPPSSFAKRFRQAYPGLFEFLQSQEDGKPASWREVEHWLWPVFTERWGRWRCNRLHLNEVPFASCIGAAAGTATRPATALMYGCSPSIVQVPGYWPDTVQVCGFWFPPHSWEHDVRVPPKVMEGFFHNTGGGISKVVAITLSTIADMGLIGESIGEAKHVVQVLTCALETAGLKGIFIISKRSWLESAWRSLYPSTDKKRKGNDADAPVSVQSEGWVGGDETVHGYVGSLPFQQLFPMCLGQGLPLVHFQIN
jgi:hypothetical protein